jgi:transposase
MAVSYVPVVREQPFLMPPDLREWLPEGHLAWFVIDAVAALDTSTFHQGRRLGGVGRRGYDPDMLLALLIYAYANGERSSRRIERLCELDVACRVVCGNLKPDHTVIARFRSENEVAFRMLFSQVVALCVAEGMGGLGVLAIDGTKIEADASRLSNRTRDQIAVEVDRIVDEAKRTDAEEDERLGDGRGDELPPEWADPVGRVERLRRALNQLDEMTADALDESGIAERVAKAETHLEEARAHQQAKVDAYQKQMSEGRKPTGRPPLPVDERSTTRQAEDRLARAKAAHAEAVKRAKHTNRGHQRKANTTDPDSRLMRSKGTWVQGYNAQAAVTEDGIVVAAAVTNQVSDAALLHPLIDQAQDLTAAGGSQRIEAVVADAGYWSEANITINDNPQPDDPEPPVLLIPPQGFNIRDAEPGPPPLDDARPAETMRHRLSTPEGKTLYAKRSAQAESPFGHLKTRFRFTRFSRRGLTAADSEWHLVLAVRNLVKLHQATPATAT